jgi:anti-anti-sigma factor
VQPHARKTQRPPPVEVDIHGSGVAVVALRGEHDLSTREEVAQALARAGDSPGVLIDLSECTFMDSSLIAELVRTSRGLETRDRRLELVIPTDAHIVQRIAKLTDIASLIPTHETREAALAALHGRLAEA